jgi:ribosomal protein S27AE
MAQLFGGIYDIIFVVIIVVVSIVIRVFLFKKSGLMRAKCPKCGNVFDASRSLAVIRLGPFRQLKCPACGKTSFMNSYVKDPVTWPPLEKQQQETSKLTEEELEKKRIEDSKYEKE